MAARHRLAIAGALAALGCGGIAESAAAQLPACSPSRNGRLAQAEVADQQPGGRHPLYATHRLGFDLTVDGDEVEEPDGYRYGVIDSGAVALAGPGVVAPNAFIGGAAGVASPLAFWTVYRSRIDQVGTPFCTGSQPVPVTLLAPKRTGLRAKRLLVDRTGSSPRFVVNVGGRGQDLSPLTVRIRRGRRGRRRTLFTVPLADAAAAGSGESSTSGLRRFRFSKRFDRMRISSNLRNAAQEASGIVTVGVKLPKARHRRRLSRHFTLELARGSRTLLRLRAVIRCRGFGRIQATQTCRTPVYRVSRPSR